MIESFFFYFGIEFIVLFQLMNGYFQELVVGQNYYIILFDFVNKYV